MAEKFPRNPLHRSDNPKHKFYFLLNLRRLFKIKIDKMTFMKNDFSLNEIYETKLTEKLTIPDFSRIYSGEKNIEAVTKAPYSMFNSFFV